MNNTTLIEALKYVKHDFSKQLWQICCYHDLELDDTYSSSAGIECILDALIKFYEWSDTNDKTSKKALAIEAVSTYGKLNLPTVLDYNFFESPIEYLFFVTLMRSFPKEIWKLAYFVPQYPVCNSKYFVDIALIDRTECRPVFAIECDGFVYHNNSKDNVISDNRRDREIKETEKIDIWHYNGSEIYNNCIELSNELWDYIRSMIYKDCGSPA